MSDLVERLLAMTQNTGRDHRSGQEFVLADSQEIIDAMREALGHIEAIERENAELRAVKERAQQFEREAFMSFIRKWARSRFGKWITFNTAKGAYSQFREEQESIRSLIPAEREDK